MENPHSNRFAGFPFSALFNIIYAIFGVSADVFLPYLSIYNFATY